MVDFNNEGTISRPPKDIVALIIIEKHYNFLEADEYYSNRTLSGIAERLSSCRSRLRNLFLTCHAMLKRRLTPEQYEQLNHVCKDLKHDADAPEIMKCFIIIHDQLDKLGLLKLDTRPVYDSTDIEASNKAQGYD